MGFNIIYPETEYVPGDTSTEFDLDSECLDEFSGDELKRNLEEQKKLPTEVAPLTKLVPYVQISQWEFDCAEQSRGLGYNGLSSQTKHRWEKEAQEQDEFWKKAQVS